LAAGLAGGTVGFAVVGVDGEAVEARYCQIHGWAEQVDLVRRAVGLAFAALVGGRDQHVLDRAEGQVFPGDLAQRQAWAELAVVGASVLARVAVEPLVVDEQEHVAPAPAAGVLEGDGLLDGGFAAILARVDREVLAVEIGQAVVLPVHLGEGWRGEQAAGQGEGERSEFDVHLDTLEFLLWCDGGFTAPSRTAVRGAGFDRSGEWSGRLGRRKRGATRQGSRSAQDDAVRWQR